MILLSQMLDAHTFITMETKAPPPHAGCLGDGNRTGNLSQHPQRAMGEGEGTGRERTPLCTPPSPCQPSPLLGFVCRQGSGFCWEQCRGLGAGGLRTGLSPVWSH